MTTATEERPLRVVVADDTDDVRLLLRVSLEIGGGIVVVAEASDGQAAIEAVAEHQPDAILIDLAMPVMDGLQAIPVLREKSPGIGIVVLSGFDAGHMADQALRDGADVYLTKGTRPADIAAALHRVVGAEHGAAGTADRPRPIATGWAEPAIQRSRSAEVAYRRNNDLLPMLAHELLNSLTVITGYASTLKVASSRGSSELVSQCVEVIQRHAAQMEALIRSGQDARSMEIGTLSLEPVVIDLRAAVREAVTDLSELLDSHRVELELGDVAATARVDPVRFRQVMTNLLTNAAKFSPPGTRVAVAVSGGDSRVEVTVSDEGPGVPAEKRDLIFEKFGRLNHKVAGSGLGLYLARGLVQASGGELELVDSAVGATFSVSLPRAVDQAGVGAS
ncbi:MAG TPA: hybrid sensor histidine kinase/response regulator [Acidimicrobiales bacterium]